MVDPPLDACSPEIRAEEICLWNVSSVLFRHEKFNFDEKGIRKMKQQDWLRRNVKAPVVQVAMTSSRHLLAPVVMSPMKGEQKLLIKSQKAVAGEGGKLMRHSSRIVVENGKPFALPQGGQEKICPEAFLGRGFMSEKLAKTSFESD